MAFLLAYPIVVVGGSIAALAGFYTCATDDAEPDGYRPIFVQSAPPPPSARDVALERLVVDESVDTARREAAARARRRDEERFAEEETTRRSLVDAHAARDPCLRVAVHRGTNLDGSWFVAAQGRVVATATLFDAGGGFVASASTRPSTGGDVGAPRWAAGGAVTLDAALRRHDLHRVRVVFEARRADAGDVLGRSAALDVAALADGGPRDVALDGGGALTVSVAFDEGLCEAVVGRLPAPPNPFVDDPADCPEGVVEAVHGPRPVVAVPVAASALPVAEVAFT